MDTYLQLLQEINSKSLGTLNRPQAPGKGSTTKEWEKYHHSLNEFILNTSVEDQARKIQLMTEHDTHEKPKRERAQMLSLCNAGSIGKSEFFSNSILLADPDFSHLVKWLDHRDCISSDSIEFSVCIKSSTMVSCIEIKSHETDHITDMRLFVGEVSDGVEYLNPCSHPCIHDPLHVNPLPLEYQYKAKTNLDLYNRQKQDAIATHMKMKFSSSPIDLDFLMNSIHVPSPPPTEVKIQSGDILVGIDDISFKDLDMELMDTNFQMFFLQRHLEKTLDKPILLRFERKVVLDSYLATTSSQEGSSKVAFSSRPRWTYSLRYFDIRSSLVCLLMQEKLILKFYRKYANSYVENMLKRLKEKIQSAIPTVLELENLKNQLSQYYEIEKNETLKKESYALSKCKAVMDQFLVEANNIQLGLAEIPSHASSVPRILLDSFIHEDDDEIQVLGMTRPKKKTVETAFIDDNKPKKARLC
jgi:hypothetical protein